MSSGYWVITFRSVSDQTGVDRYTAAAGPVIQAHGGQVLAAGPPAISHEAGTLQRVAIVKFSNLEAANAAYCSPEYQAAVQYLVGAAERDVRIIEGA